MNFDAHIGGLTFVGDGRRAAYTIASDGLTGWLAGGVSMRRDVADRPTSHGQFGAPGYLSGRMISLTGMVNAESAFDFERRLSALSALLADGGEGQMVVQGAETTRATVARWDEPEIRVLVYGRIAEYKLRLWSHDPRRYGETVTFSSGPVFQRGNFAASPVLTVTGNMPAGYSINGPDGRVFTVTAGLSAGSTDVIDMRTGWVKRNGTDLDAATSRADTWTIAPGKQVTHTLVPVSGSGQLVTKITDTYV